MVLAGEVLHLSVEGEGVEQEHYLVVGVVVEVHHQIESLVGQVVEEEELESHHHDAVGEEGVVVYQAAVALVQVVVEGVVDLLL